MGILCFAFDISAIFKLLPSFSFSFCCTKSFLTIGSHFHKKFAIGVTVVAFTTVSEQEVKINFVPWAKDGCDSSEKLEGLFLKRI